MSERPETANRRHWDAKSDDYQAGPGAVIGSSRRLLGGWAIPEETIGVVGPVAGLDVLETGCGAADWSAWLADDGASAIGLDISAERLSWATTRHAGALPLVQADGAALPFADASFDLVFSDHGSFSWCPPEQAVAETARVLRPGGRLVFNTLSPIAAVCFDEQGRLTDKLHRDYFDLYSDTGDDGATWYVLPLGRWIRLFRQCSLAVEDLVELRPPAEARSPFYAEQPEDWHHRWPAETTWVLTKSHLPARDAPIGTRSHGRLPVVRRARSACPFGVSGESNAVP